MTKKASISQVALLYLKSFAEKDIGSLEVLFADNITLSDWDGHLVGKEHILAFNRKVFANVNTIGIDIVKVAVGQATVMVEIKIILNNTTNVNVVDVIEFDDDNKIKSIKAYKR
jgi:hypothetical protein